MDYLQFTLLRNSAREYFDKVEKGKSYVIVRKGKPIAKVIPFKNPVQGWKREVKTVTLRRGGDSTKILRQIRDEE
ncbi:MAG: type II toxin-antitoxin system Phd/YefM family antitoxin [Cyclobacteriaceae bacterium]|jgi:prevent-host-death family protein